MHEEMASLIPNPFGSLQGVRILSTGSLVAQPFAAAMAAEMGAEVIQLEQPGPGDALWRTLEFPIQGENGDSVAAGWVQMRRNSFHTTLDMSNGRSEYESPESGGSRLLRIHTSSGQRRQAFLLRSHL